MPKNILFFVLTALLFLSPLVVVGDDAHLRQLETIYPDIPGVDTIGEDTTLPEYLEYIYYFIISLTGIAALIILIWGGLIYLTSAGSPNKMKDGISAYKVSYQRDNQTGSPSKKLSSKILLGSYSFEDN